MSKCLESSSDDRVRVKLQLRIRRKCLIQAPRYRTLSHSEDYNIRASIMTIEVAVKEIIIATNFRHLSAILKTKNCIEMKTFMYVCHSDIHNISKRQPSNISGLGFQILRRSHDWNAPPPPPPPPKKKWSKVASFEN